MHAIVVARNEKRIWQTALQVPIIFLAGTELAQKVEQADPGCCRWLESWERGKWFEPTQLRAWKLSASQILSKAQITSTRSRDNDEIRLVVKEPDNDAMNYLDKQNRVCVKQNVIAEHVSERSFSEWQISVLIL